MDEIADLAVRITSQDSPARLVIGAPLYTDEKQAECICHARIDGYESSTRYLIYGCDTLQALTCGLFFLSLHLNDLQSKGVEFLPVQQESTNQTCFDILRTRAPHNDADRAVTLDTAVLDNRAAEVTVFVKSAKRTDETMVIVTRPYTYGPLWYCNLNFCRSSGEETFSFESTTSLGALCAALRGLSVRLTEAEENGSLLYRSATTGRMRKFCIDNYFFHPPDYWTSRGFGPRRIEPSSLYALTLWNSYLGGEKELDPAVKRVNKILPVKD